MSEGVFIGKKISEWRLSFFQPGISLGWLTYSAEFATIFYYCYICEAAEETPLKGAETMITLFNRKQVLTTFSMKKQAEIKDILDHNGITYYEKVVNRRNVSLFGNGTRSRTGSFGEDTSYMYEYTIYVHKKDYESANKCIFTL